MRSVHLRFSDHTYGLIQQEADALEVSVAQFSRVAVVARAALWEALRALSFSDECMSKIRGPLRTLTTHGRILP